MSHSVVKQVADLAQMSTRELKERWWQLVGSEPPQYNREFLVKRLAYRIQELAYGGLALSAREKMNQMLDEAGYDAIGGLDGKSRESKRRQALPVLGTRLVREWDGERHEVTVVPDGFEYRGRRFRSLSAVARLITGTRWNGPAFFGLRRKDRQ